MTDGWQRGIILSAPNGGRPGGPCIVKIGGSLLAATDWPKRLARLLHEESDGRPRLLVVGGGAVVDGLRRIDATSPQPQALMHRLAIEAMGMTGRLVAASLGLPFVTAPRDDAAAVLDVPAWLDQDGRFAALPVGWHVTSDSIAAFAAATLRADLLLAKSVPPPRLPAGEPLLELLAGAGWIDPFFPEAAAEVERIAWACPASVPPPAVGRTSGEGLGPGRGGVA